MVLWTGKCVKKNRTEGGGCGDGGGGGVGGVGGGGGDGGSGGGGIHRARFKHDVPPMP